MHKGKGKGKEKLFVIKTSLQAIRLCSEHKAQVCKVGCQVKAVIVSRQWKQDGLSAKAMAIIELLKPIHSVYPDSYKFAKDSVYYDTKANPDRHLKAYYLLMRICEREKVKANQCFPLHTSWVPGHMQIDTRILHEKFVSGKLQGQKSDAELIWREVLDYDAKLIKTRANSKFGKSIMTDGVSVSVLRMDHQKLLEGQLQQDNCPYMENISSSELAGTTGCCVLVDPGWCDLLFCMKETSSPEQPEIYCYTSNQKANSKQLLCADEDDTPTVQPPNTPAAPAAPVH
ncbi:hypothetical protein EV177_004172 [Coemansia sp. RSA 1804]|nr:hypothetical protein EV177_004172 [Coemansia sp. RSA 1804]